MKLEVGLLPEGYCRETFQEENAVWGRAGPSTAQLPVASRTALQAALLGNNPLPVGNHIVVSGWDKYSNRKIGLVVLGVLPLQTDATNTELLFPTNFVLHWMQKKFLNAE